jgi:flavin-dependent dehydrogenase
MLDLIIAGAGPAGSVAALVAARAGARVLVVDRETFPREKLCGDTLNPGAIKLLGTLDLTGGPLAAATPLAGMRLTGPGRSVEARYGADLVGLALRRRDLDQWLLDRAIAAGAHFEPGLVARRALVDESGGAPHVRGLVLSRRGAAASLLRIPANFTIAADGRSSALARSLGLASYPPRPRRWAFGVYVSGVAGLGDLGEMHIRAGGYLGIAPMGRGLCNVCAVVGRRPAGATPLAVVRGAVGADPAIGQRFEQARYETPVSVLGPLAVDVRAVGVTGLLLAGDAAGFVDPMTGDGLHLAMRGAVLAAREALASLESGDLPGAVARLESARRDALRRKQRFNRAMRRLVESPAAIEAAAWGARFAPGLVRWAIRYAGDAA